MHGSPVNRKPLVGSQHLGRTTTGGSSPRTTTYTRFMFRQSRSLTLLTAIALFAVACSNGGAMTEATAGTAAEQASVVADTADGGQIDLGSLEGSDSLLWFWAPW